MKFLIVVTPTERGFTAQAPDADGCVATGRTPDQVERQIRAALEYHIIGLRQRGEEPPLPKSYCTQVEIVASTHDLETVS